jgi:hypothetical protein
MKAQELPSEIFGEYVGDARITNVTFGIDQTIEISVELEEKGVVEDYFLKILDFNIVDTVQISIEMDKVIITPFEGGYKLSRTESITFTIPEVYVPPIPPLLPEGGVFYDVPVKVTLGNSEIVDLVLKLKLEVVATIKIFDILPLPIPFNIEFEGLLSGPPPSITTTALPKGTVGEEYSATLEAEGMPPIIWEMMSGDLPTGLTLDPLSGTISGIPTEANNFHFAVTATNNWGYDWLLLSIEIEDIDTTGIRTTEFAPFKVYPNPTTGELTIENGELTIKDVKIFDIYGRMQNAECRMQEVPRYARNDEGIVELDISHLLPGIYFIRIDTGINFQVCKIIKI